MFTALTVSMEARRDSAYAHLFALHKTLQLSKKKIIIGFAEMWLSRIRGLGAR